MYTLLKPLLVREELLKRHIRIFTPQVFARLFPAPPYTIKYFLKEQTHQGLFLRLKQGLYSLKTDPPSEEEVANALYKPSYISFEYALAYYNILPEMPYTITSATTKPTRLFTTQTKTFSYHTIKKRVFTGYLLKKNGDKAFLIAEPEKALVDYLYFVILNKKLKRDRLVTNGLTKEKILNYAKLYQRKSLLSLVKTLI